MNTKSPTVGTITIPLTPEQERQLQEHADACPSCAKVNAGQAPTEARCDAGNELIWSFGADLRNAAFEAASNVPSPPDWLTPKERVFKAALAEHEERTRRTPLIPAHFFCVWTPGAPTIPGWYAFEWKSPDGKTHVSVGEHTEEPRALWVGGLHESVLKYRDTVIRHTPIQVPEAPENYGRPIMEAAVRAFLAGGVKLRERGKTQNFGEGHPYGFGDRIAERVTIDAPPPLDLLEATRPEPPPYAKIYTNGEISPPSRIPTPDELRVLRPFVNFAGFGSLVAAMAFAIYAESRGMIPCPGRTVKGCGDGEDECELCGSQGEIPISGPLPSEHPDPFVRDVIAAVGALAEAPDESTMVAARLFGVLPEQVTPEQVTPEQVTPAKNMLFGLRYGKRAEPEDDPKPALRALAAYDNARHAPSCHPCQGTITGSGDVEGQGCDETKGTP